MLGDEALHLQMLVGTLVWNASKCFGRRAVVGQLEQATQQDRHVVELCAGAGFDGRDQLVAQVGIGAAEIEQELNFHGVHR